MDVVTLGAALSIMKKMPDTAASSAAAADDAADRAEEAARTLTVDDTLTKPGQPADSKAVGDTLAEKLDIADLPDTVDNANQLLSEKYVVDTEPYHFRPSGGQGADRAFDTIVGGSVVWNQPVPIPNSSISRTTNGIILTDNRDGSYTFSTESGGATVDTSLSLFSVANAINRGHVYFLGGGVGGNPSTYQLQDLYNCILSYSFKKENIYKTSTYLSTSVGHLDLRLTVKSGIIVSTPITFNPYYVDLTQMFGSEIADYIYSLEQATAGAGVTWFRKYFPNDFYEYSAPTLRHVEGVSQKEVVGFNQWDEVFETGGIDDSTGQNTTTSSQRRSKNYIPALPNTAYYFSFPMVGSGGGYIYCYDADKNFLERAKYNSVYNVANQVITTPNNCNYMRFKAQSASHDYSDICISLSDPAKNGQYEPYKKNIYPLDSTLTMRGIPKLVDGKLTFDGDIYKPDGTVERRYGTRAYESGDESLSNAITDGTNTVYKLTTPTTEQAQSFQSPQVLDPYGTEEYVTTSLVPVGHETKYPENLRAKIEGLPGDMGMIAPVEKTNKATRNYTSGRLLVMGNTLYKVTANIAKDGTITPGTNVTATTIDEIIAALA